MLVPIIQTTGRKPILMIRAMCCLLLAGWMSAEVVPVDTPATDPAQSDKVSQGPAQAAAVAQALPQRNGSYSRESTFSSDIITTQDRWTQLWQRIDVLPEIAFDESREMAVFIAIGERPTGGFRPRVVRATVEKGNLVVVVNEGKPAREEFVMQALTQPWVLVVVPKSPVPVVVRMDPPAE